MNRDVGRRVAIYLAIAVVIVVLGLALSAWNKRLEIQRVEAEVKLAAVLRQVEELRDSIVVVRRVSDSTQRLERAHRRERDEARQEAAVAESKADSMAAELATRPVDSTTASLWREAYLERTKEASALRVSVESAEAELRLVREDRDRAFRMIARQDTVLVELRVAFREAIEAQKCRIGPLECPPPIYVALISVVGTLALK